MHFGKSFLDMMVIVSFCFLIFLKNCHQISGLEELPAAPDNDILKTAAVVKDIVNNIFKELHLDPSVRRKAQIEYLSLVHKYLVKLTSRDYANLKEIARLTHVDRTRDKTNNNVTYFMTILDELLNEIPKANATEVISDTHNDFTNKTKDTDPVNAINKLNANIDIEATQYDVDLDNIDVDDLMKHFKFNESVYDNGTLDDQAFKESESVYDNGTLNDQVFKESDSEENSTIVDDSDFWTPSARRIFKGLKTKIKHFPFMATINIFGQFTCAGSIISSDLVITACSCVQLAYNNRFFRENPKFLTVRVGSSFYVGGGEVISVLEVYFHPNYEPRSLKNNLALLRLEKHISFSKHGKKKKIKKIALDTNARALPMNTDGVTIVGWGATTTSNKLSHPWTNRLAYAILDIYSLEDCQDIYSSDYVTKKHFCAGFISHGGGACNRDVGGPGIVDGVLTGVVTFGSPTCGELDSPTVFTKIGFYNDWIEDIMSQEVPWKLAKTTTQWPYLTYPSSYLVTTKIFKLRPINHDEIDNPQTYFDIGPDEMEPKVDQVIRSYVATEIIDAKKQKIIKGNENAAFDVAVTMLNTGTVLNTISTDQPISNKSSKSPDSKSVSVVPVTKLMVDSKEEEHLRIEEKLIEDLIDTVLGKGKKDDYEDLLREVNEKEEKTKKTKSFTNALTKTMATVAPERDIEAKGKDKKDDNEEMLREVNKQEQKSQRTIRSTKVLIKTRPTVALELDKETKGKGKKYDYEDLLREVNEPEEKTQRTKSLTKTLTKTRATVASELDIEAFISMILSGPLNSVENYKSKVTEGKMLKNNKHRFSKSDRQLDYKKIKHTAKSKLRIETSREETNINKHRSAKSERLDDKELKIKHAAQSKPKVDIAGGNKHIIPKAVSNPVEDIEDVLFYLGTLYESQKHNYSNLKESAKANHINLYKPAKANHINLNKPAKANHINLNMPFKYKTNEKKMVQVNDPKSVTSEGMSIEMFKSVQRRGQNQDELEFEDTSIDQNFTDTITATT